VLSVITNSDGVAFFLEVLPSLWEVTVETVPSRATEVRSQKRKRKKAPLCGAFSARPERFELPTFGSVVSHLQGFYVRYGPLSASQCS
jgi:hypothetical protein